MLWYLPVSETTARIPAAHMLGTIALECQGLGDGAMRGHGSHPDVLGSNVVSESLQVVVEDVGVPLRAELAKSGLLPKSAPHRVCHNSLSPRSRLYLEDLCHEPGHRPAPSFLLLVAAVVFVPKQRRRAHPRQPRLLENDLVDDGVFVGGGGVKVLILQALGADKRLDIGQACLFERLSHHEVGAANLEKRGPSSPNHFLTLVGPVARLAADGVVHPNRLLKRFV